MDTILTLFLAAVLIGLFALFCITAIRVLIERIKEYVQSKAREKERKAAVLNKFKAYIVARDKFKETSEIAEKEHLRQERDRAYLYLLETPVASIDDLQLKLRAHTIAMRDSDAGWQLPDIDFDDYNDTVGRYYYSHGLQDLLFVAIVHDLRRLNMWKQPFWDWPSLIFVLILAFSVLGAIYNANR